MTRERPELRAGADVPPEDIRLLARFRHVLRQFFAFSEKSAKKAGVTVQQHRAVLSIEAAGGEATVGDLANDLLIRHHSAVGLADRLVRAGLVTRHSNPADRRRVTLAVTARGEAMLSAVTRANLQELQRLMPQLRAVIEELER